MKLRFTIFPLMPSGKQTSSRGIEWRQNSYLRSEEIPEIYEQESWWNFDKPWWENIIQGYTKHHRERIIMHQQKPPKIITGGNNNSDKFG